MTEHYGWETITDQLAEIYQDHVERKSRELRCTTHAPTFR